MPLIALDSVSIAFGHRPLLDGVSLLVEAGERLAVIGRNGTGKSTLLQILAGELLPDSGTVARSPALRVSRLAQDAAATSDQTVFDSVADGLGDLAEVVAAYHRAAMRVSVDASAEAMAKLDRAQHALDECDGWRVEQRVEFILSRLNLDGNRAVLTLSGGWRRRVLLAKALVAQPALLLLDEPTNHLDIEAIVWLETFLADYAGAVVFVTHDREFLQRVSTRVVELDRGRLTSWPGDYKAFVDKKEAWLQNEAIAEEKFDKRLSEEEAWVRRGIKARRTRDEGRVKRLVAMRQERAERRARTGRVNLQLDPAERSGRMVFEAEGVSKTYGRVPVVRNFSARILRGDRIGLIGPNGVGKTTLLKLLTGELAPDSGVIRTGVNVAIAYFDQQREQLDPARTVVDTIADGNDTVTVGGRTRHVFGYLEDFLFPPERARSPVKSLSGGERNRLLLARLLTRPANVLILDEPTNDLDIETLELLEDQLADYPGTLILVSHDRRFLDNIVTSTLVFEGDGVIQEYVGGYEDWIRQRTGQESTEKTPSPEAKPSTKAVVEKPKTKLSYKEKLELEQLPARLAELEAEQARLQALVHGPDFYKESPAVIRETLARLSSLDDDLRQIYERWDALDSMQR